MTRNLFRYALAALLAAVGLPAFAPAANAQTWLFWIDTNYASPKLGRAFIDGTHAVTVPLTADFLPEGLTLDPSGNGTLYFTESAWTGARVRSIGASLTSPGLVAAEESSLHGIALDAPNHTLYWTSSNLVTGPTIERADVSGASHLILEALGATSNPRGIVVDAANSRLIWAEYNTGALMSCPLTGGAITMLALLPPGSWGLALDNVSNRLFVTNYINGTIQSMFPPYNVANPVLSGLANPTYVAADPSAGELYWVEGGVGAQKIQRASELGFGAVILPLTETTYGGIAVGSPALADVGPGPEQREIKQFALLAPTPNPAHSVTYAEFDLPRAAYTVIRVLDVQGREVARLVDGDFPAGRHFAEWSLGAQRSPAAGVYFLRMEAGGLSFTRRLAVVR